MRVARLLSAFLMLFALALCSCKASNQASASNPAPSTTCSTNRWCRRTMSAVLAQRATPQSGTQPPLARFRHQECLFSSELLGIALQMSGSARS